MLTAFISYDGYLKFASKISPSSLYIAIECLHWTLKDKEMEQRSNAKRFVIELLCFYSDYYFMLWQEGSPFIGLNSCCLVYFFKLDG